MLSFVPKGFASPVRWSNRHAKIYRGEAEKRGMRWSVDGANKIAALRSCIKSNRFDDFWYQKMARSVMFTRKLTHTQFAVAPLNSS